MDFDTIAHILISQKRHTANEQQFAHAQNQRRFLAMLAGPSQSGCNSRNDRVNQSASVNNSFGSQNQLDRCLEHLLGPKQELSDNCEMARSHYLQHVHAYRISKQELSATIQFIIRLGLHCDLLDQTIVQAVMYFECYVAKNAETMKEYLREVALVALVLAIKNNEDKILSLQECVSII